MSFVHAACVVLLTISVSELLGVSPAVQALHLFGCFERFYFETTLISKTYLTYFINVNLFNHKI